MLDKYHISSESNFQQKIDGSKKPIVIAFCSEISGVCQMMRPIFEDFEYEYGNKANLMIIEDMKYAKLSEQYNVNHFPTILFIKNKEVVDRVEGILSRKEFNQKIRFLHNNTENESNIAC